MMYNFYRVIRFIIRKLSSFISQHISFLLFKINKIDIKKGFSSRGVPILLVEGDFVIGENFKINNRVSDNPIGRNYRCMFVIGKEGKLDVGKNVGMSGISIVCQKKISIGDNVKLGGNVCIYDTDFHALNSTYRNNTQEDRKNTNIKEVVIHDNVFIGAHSTVLKGVSIGENSIIGACSVVTKDIPANQIWAGNPAKFIRHIQNK